MTLSEEKVRPALAAYSQGQISRRSAMDQAGLSPDQYSGFVEAMQSLSIPWPAVDPAQVEQEAGIVAQAIAGATDHED